jgi:hypothetical protein
LISYTSPAKSGRIQIEERSFDFEQVTEALRSDHRYIKYFGIESHELDSADLHLTPIPELMSAPPVMHSEPMEAAPPELFETIRPEPAPEIEVASPFRAGQLDYEIPDVMQQHQPMVCTVRLAGTEVAAEDIRISDISIHAAIQITNEMSVRLVDPSEGVNFRVAAISSERQAIRKGDITEWKISVTPLKAGTFSLFLRVSAHFDGKTQDMELLEKSIRVNGDLTKSTEEIARQIQKKIIFLAADSKSGLLLGRESNKIREELRMSTRRDDFLYTTIFEVTGFDFSRTLLREKPTIVHFSGHGNAEGIFLVNEREMPQLASTEALRKLFGILKKVLKIECVILNACFSKTQAEVVAQSIPVVVGTQCKIGDNEAINFSVGFYQGLGEGLLYDDAFELGRVQVSFNSDDEDAEEVLVLLKNAPRD